MLNYDLHMREHESEHESYDVHGNVIYNNPFPGLRAFSIDECHLFFGREGQVDEVLVKLSENRFVTVMGYSGSGKSSLMYCGLIPILYGGFMTHAGANWNVVVARPGTSPIESLAESLIKSDPTYKDATEEELLVNKTVISSLLRSSPDGLVDAIERIHKKSGVNTLILADQFEELFRFKDGESEENAEEAKQYVNLLLRACHNRDIPIYVAITMRSDYIGDCAKFPGLTDLINQSNYLVPQMTRDQKRMAIEGPVAVGGGQISQRLVRRLLNEIGDNQDQLPILQHALMRTWDYWLEYRQDKEPIDIRHYNAVGRISEALSQHANEAYDELSSREKEIAEILFKSLTEKTNDNFGMRRPVRLGLVSELAGATDEEVITVVEKFRQKGRSFLMPSASVKLTPNSLIEISHESLMRIWTRLKVWVDEEHESAQMYRRLSEAAAMYQIGRTSLWRPPDLQLALNWQKKQKPTREWAQRYDEAFERAIVFLDTSRITYEAEQKNQEILQKRLLTRTKIVAAILGIAAVVAMIFFVFAVVKNIEANKQRELAEDQKKEAVEQKELAEKAQALAELQQKRAESEEQNARNSERAAKAALAEADRQRLIAEQNFNIAQEQRNIADVKRLEAQDQRQKAENEYERAENNYTKAQKLLYQSVAQSMAVKSISIEDDNLKGLLAQQAYMFNKEYDGRIYDPYIYSSLRTALNQLQGETQNTIAGVHRNSVRSIVFLNQSDKFFSTGTEGKIASSSISDLSANSVISSNPHPNRVLAINNANDKLVVASDSSYIQVFNVNGQGTVASIVGHSSYVNDISFIPGSNRFVSVGGDNQIRINNINDLSSELFDSLSYEIKTIDIHPRSKYLAGGTLDGKLVIIDMDDKTSVVSVNVPNNPIHAVKFSNDGKLLAIGDEEGNVKLIDVNNNQIIRTLIGHKGRVSDLAFSPDGKILASGSLDNTIQMWIVDQLDELPIRLTDNDAYIWDIEFSPDANYIIAACADGEIRKWPTNSSLMADQVCGELKRNMTPDEWETYVANDIPFMKTCVQLLLNDY